MCSSCCRFQIQLTCCCADMDACSDAAIALLFTRVCSSFTTVCTACGAVERKAESCQEHSDCAQHSTDIHTLCSQDNKKIKSEEPYFELLTTELAATEERVFNVSRFLPAIRSAVLSIGKTRSYSGVLFSRNNHVPAPHLQVMYQCHPEGTCHAKPPCHRLEFSSSVINLHLMHQLQSCGHIEYSCLAGWT